MPNLAHDHETPRTPGIPRMHGRARTQGARGPGAHDRQRHEQMIRCVFDWMNRTRGTQQLLVRCIEDFWHRRGEAHYRCDHSLLSRILNPQDPHVPTPGRPQSMRILQAAMIVCAPSNDPNVVAPAGDEDSAWTSDEEQAFKVHRARLRHLREHGRDSLFESLTRIGEFCAAARGMNDQAVDAGGESYRARASENVLLALAALIDAGADSRRLRDQLTDEAVAAGEAQRLEDLQVARVEAIHLALSSPGPNALAYGGAVLFHCGQRPRGMAMLIEAARNSCDAAKRHDPHWETLLELLDRLLESDDAEGQRWSREAAQVAQTQLGPRGLPGSADLLRHGWQMVRAPRVREDWRSFDPGLIAQLEGEPAKSRGPAVGKNGRVVAGLLPLVMAFLTMLAGGPLAMADRQAAREVAPQVVSPGETSMAIRGREAARPAPPPPTGDPAPTPTADA